MSYKELATTIARLSDKLDIAKDFIAELKAESDQWQESCGQNFVRAEQAEDRVNWFEQENDKLHKRIAELEEDAKLDAELILHLQTTGSSARIAELEAALEEIRDYPSSQPLALNVPDEDWQRMRSREISAIAWQALEESK